jgi:uncharacterized protein
MTETLLEEPKVERKHRCRTSRQPREKMPRVRRRIAGFVIAVQTLLFAGHWFVYETWMHFSPPATPRGTLTLQIALALLSVSFVASSMLAFRYRNYFVRAFYTFSAAWIGVLNYLAMAACACWIVWFGALAIHAPVDRHKIGAVCLAAAVLVSFYGIANAWWVRVKRISVKLPGLPVTWRGRTAALVTDVHLGHVRGRGFMARVIDRIRRHNPDIVFISGDLFDGGRADAGEMTSPWRDFSPALGTYFVTGNHEGFSNQAAFLDAVKKAGIRALENELLEVDGLQVVGVNYSDSVNPQRYRDILEDLDVDRGRASILLLHVPHGMAISEQFGISLQLSGHTHGGQLFPFTWFTRRIFGAYIYGLQKFGAMNVYTSSGAGTWGPPLRVGTQPEIVLIHFE